MIIIIEGCDGCYKTTVATLLKEKLGFPIVKGSSFELSQCSNEYLFDHFKQLSKSENIIMDRSMYSNLVYASLYQGYAILTEEQRIELEALYKPKTLLLYLYADGEVIKERLNSRGDDHVENEMVDKIIEKYNEVLVDSVIDDRIKYLAYDTNELGSKEIAERVLFAVEHFTRGDA